MYTLKLFVSVQFHRSFPGPAEVSPAEITALAQYYYDPATGLHNYLQFHNDIVSFDGGEGGATTLEIMPTVAKVTYMFIHNYINIETETQVIIVDISEPRSG